MDLFSAGLEYNAGAGVSLDDSRKALLQYRSSLDSLRPTEVRVADRLWPDQTEFEYSAGGVYPNVDGSSLRLFTMGPTSRGVPQKEWEIPLPVVNLAGYGLCPEDDVIAFVDLQEANLVRLVQSSITNPPPMLYGFPGRNPSEVSLGWCMSSCRRVPNNSLLGC